jgi:hypothetical protein
MKNDWVLFDFVGAFMPDWLRKVVNLKMISAVVLALMVFVIVLKAKA